MSFHNIIDEVDKAHLELRELLDRVERDEGEGSFCGISVGVDARVLLRMIPLMHAALDQKVLLLVDEEFRVRLDEFLKYNAGEGGSLDDAEIQALRRLRFGGVYQGGGGAAACWDVKRL